LSLLGKAVGPLELDVFDRETAGVGGGCRLRRLGVLAGQILEFLKASLLLFEQAVLAVTDKVGVTGGRCSNGNLKWRQAQQSYAQPRHEGG
jgi:hypothetical protein